MLEFDWLNEYLNTDDSTRQERALAARLQERARAYATLPPPTLPESIERLPVVTFSLGEDTYALDVRVVRGVRTLERLTRVPSVPPFYKGVVSVRGQMMTVFELRAFIDVPIADSTPPRELLLVQAHGLELGIIVHHVDDVLFLPKPEINPFHAPYTLGITNERVVLLDHDTLFADERLIIERSEA